GTRGSTFTFQLHQRLPGEVTSSLHASIFPSYSFQIFAFDGFSCILFIFPLAAKSTPPSVFPLVPCCTKTSSAPMDQTLACLVTGYFPQKVKIQWNSLSDPAGSRSFPEVLKSDGLYTTSSMLAITASNRQSNPYHSCLRSSLEPTIYMSKPSYEDLIKQPGRVSCLVLGYDLAATAITWEVDGKVSSAVKTEPTEALTYHLLPVECLLSQALNAASCPQPGGGDCDRRPLEVFILPPSLEDLYIVRNATITCAVSGMETPGSLEVSWTRASGRPLDVVSREPALQDNGTYSTTSILRVCVEEWQVGEEFTCIVKHRDIPSAIVKTIHKSQAPIWLLEVYLYPPHAEELALRELATITCLASGFWPRDILVMWTQQDRPVPQEAYTNVGPVQEPGKKHYFIYSKLNVLASEWQSGDTFACVVGHESLPLTFIHRSVDKASSKPTAVNVSVILSDTDVTC
uniref:Ig-like domain-containing protein n=1 Tax=Pelusios castaneus TaxID=367368 RepID=A0A8C8S7R7_9SAUR